jgi:hypothetical protein
MKIYRVSNKSVDEYRRKDQTLSSSHATSVADDERYLGIFIGLVARAALL